jgi:hypothetical protein
MNWLADNFAVTLELDASYEEMSDWPTLPPR